MTSVDLLNPRIASICIEVSGRCNLRCVYCHKADPVLEALPGANDDMTDEQIDQLYEFCKVQKIRAVSLSLGGETTVVQGWYKKIDRFLEDKDLRCHIVSNFARPLIDDELVAFTKFDELQVSFDSSDLGMVRRLRSKADLRTITYNIIRLRQKARDLGRRPFIVVNATLCRDNVGHIAGLAGFCRELGVDQLNLTEMLELGGNPNMPESLDTLSHDELITLGQQLTAARAVLDGSGTEFRVREHLQARIDSFTEELHTGADPNVRGSLDLPSVSSACRQPWDSPFVKASGRVYPCCGSVKSGPVGDLTTTSIGDVVNSEASRAVRASILAGKPIVACEGCSFARNISFPEFVHDIEEWFGVANPVVRDSEMVQITWPKFLSSGDYPVITENCEVQLTENAGAFLVEKQLNGMHRLLADFDAAAYSAITFRVRPAGRRRLRLDVAEKAYMRGRANLIFSQYPSANITLGEFTCAITRTADGWFSVKAAFSSPISFSHINLTLMREDNAINYLGDGSSGLSLSSISLM
jgi:MoaA/NifB/PqqE/SkfB family radical SAM enzyme